MRWFRSRIRSLVVVALFALASQFALSFGHIHLEQFAAAAEASQTGHGSAPGSQPFHHSDDACPICIAAGMLASGQLPPPPLVPVPPIVVAEAAVIAAAPFEAAAPALAFRSRAPPIA